MIYVKTFMGLNILFILTSFEPADTENTEPQGLRNYLEIEESVLGHGE